MPIKFYKNKETGDQVIVTNDEIRNYKTDERYVLYMFRGEKELFIMPYLEFISNHESL